MSGEPEEDGFSNKVLAVLDQFGTVSGLPRAMSIAADLDNMAKASRMETELELVASSQASAGL
jgi:hypothetical protein